LNDDRKTNLKFILYIHVLYMCLVSKASSTRIRC